MRACLRARAFSSAQMKQLAFQGGMQGGGSEEEQGADMDEARTRPRTHLRTRPCTRRALARAPTEGGCPACPPSLILLR